MRSGSVLSLLDVIGDGHDVTRVVSFLRSSTINSEDHASLIILCAECEDVVCDDGSSSGAAGSCDTPGSGSDAADGVQMSPLALSRRALSQSTSRPASQSTSQPPSVPRHGRRHLSSSSLPAVLTPLQLPLTVSIVGGAADADSELVGESPSQQMAMWTPPTTPGQPARAQSATSLEDVRFGVLGHDIARSVSEGPRRGHVKRGSGFHEGEWRRACGRASRQPRVETYVASVAAAVVAVITAAAAAVVVTVFLHC